MLQASIAGALPTGLEVPKQLYVAGIAVGVRMSWTDGACLCTIKTTP